MFGDFLSSARRAVDLLLGRSLEAGEAHARGVGGDGSGIGRAPAAVVFEAVPIPIRVERSR